MTKQNKLFDAIRLTFFDQYSSIFEIIEIHVIKRIIAHAHAHTHTATTWAATVRYGTQMIWVKAFVFYFACFDQIHVEEIMLLLF